MQWGLSSVISKIPLHGADACFEKSTSGSGRRIGSSWLCSFESICENLHLDANYIRRGLKQYYDPVAFSSTPPPVQRRRTPRTNSHLTVVHNRATQQDGDRAVSLGQARAKETLISEEKTHIPKKSA
jgi:hypothetical protein